MKSRTFAPRKLDIGAFIESGEELGEASPVPVFERLADGLAKDVDVAALPAITWSAQGRLVPQRMGEPHQWLDIEAEGELAWECQRCLHAVTLPIAFARSIRFVKDEAAAAELDADSDDDVLALSRNFDLLEDELIMAQPLVPRHDACPSDVAALMTDDSETPVPGSVALQVDEAEEGVPLTASGRPNPFAVLAALKKDKG